MSINISYYVLPLSLVYYMYFFAVFLFTLWLHAWLSSNLSHISWTQMKMSQIIIGCKSLQNSQGKACDEFCYFTKETKLSLALEILIHLQNSLLVKTTLFYYTKTSPLSCFSDDFCKIVTVKILRSFRRDTLNFSF